MTAVVSALQASGQGPNDPTLRTTVSLVIAPTTVRDSSNNLVRDVPDSDFVLLDNGVQQEVRVEDDFMPISLVLAVQATVAARKPLHKLRQVGSLFGPLVVGGGGEAALVGIRNDVELAVDFTSDIDRIARKLRSLEAKRVGCSLVDAVAASTKLLSARGANRRKVILVMAESRDRTSKADLGETLSSLQREHVTVFALTYSPFLMNFGREVPIAPDT